MVVLVVRGGGRGLGEAAGVEVDDVGTVFVDDGITGGGGRGEVSWA